MRKTGVWCGNYNNFPLKQGKVQIKSRIKLQNKLKARRDLLGGNYGERNTVGCEFE